MPISQLTPPTDNLLPRDLTLVGWYQVRRLVDIGRVLLCSAHDSHFSVADCYLSRVVTDILTGQAGKREWPTEREAVRKAELGKLSIRHSHSAFFPTLTLRGGKPLSTWP